MARAFVSIGIDPVLITLLADEVNPQMPTANHNNPATHMLSPLSIERHGDSPWAMQTLRLTWVLHICQQLTEAPAHQIKPRSNEESHYETLHEWLASVRARIRI